MSILAAQCEWRRCRDNVVDKARAWVEMESGSGKEVGNIYYDLTIAVQALQKAEQVIKDLEAP